MNGRLPVRAGMMVVLGVLSAGQQCGVAPQAPVGGGGGGNLIGVWRAFYNDPFVGPTTVDLVLQANNSFSESYTSAVSLTYISGQHFIDFAGTPGLLRLSVLDWYPKEFCGPLGCTAIQPIAGESWLYTFIDANTLQLVNAGCADATVPGCTLIHTRQ